MKLQGVKDSSAAHGKWEIDERKEGRENSSVVYSAKSLAVITRVRRAL